MNDEVRKMLDRVLDYAIRAGRIAQREADAKVVEKFIDGYCSKHHFDAEGNRVEGQFCEEYGCSTLLEIAREIREQDIE